MAPTRYGEKREERQGRGARNKAQSMGKEIPEGAPRK